VTASTAGAYTLSLTCSNAAGSVTSLPAAVVVSQGTGGSCPAGRVLTSDIAYPGAQGAVRHGADLTLFENIWGHLTPTDPTVPWPGITGDTVTITTIAKTGYIGAGFHVPIGTNINLGGYYSNDGYNAGPNIDIAVSTTCGDFNPAQAGCHKEDRIANDSHSLDWRMQNPTSYQCALTPDTDYYVNIRFHDPNTTGPGCTGSTCRLTLLHQWSIQTP
jgi:PKD repeat protein